MISRILYWRMLAKDRIFLLLAGLALASFIAIWFARHPALERTTEPLNLGVTFFLVNCLFALVSARREPLLSYMFLTAAILLNGTLFFYFRYLLSIQTG